MLDNFKFPDEEGDKKVTVSQEDDSVVIQADAEDDVEI